MAPIKQANDTYENWLRAQLNGDIVERDLREKRKKMAAGPFPFLRATFWRWAETILDICPELATSPRCLAVGDIHLENFGTWRDDDGRLVWGVNDYDEAAEIPYSLDLVAEQPQDRNHEAGRRVSRCADSACDGVRACEHPPRKRQPARRNRTRPCQAPERMAAQGRQCSGQIRDRRI